MNTPAVRVLMVEENRSAARLLQRFLARADDPAFAYTHVACLADAIAKTRQDAAFDVALLDLSLPDSQGVETVADFHAAAPLLPIAALTGENDDDLGIRTLRAGAQDYLCKDDVNQWLLVRSLRHAMERKRLEGQLAERSSILEARIAACTVEADLQAARLRVLAAELSQTEHRERQRLARLFHEHFQQLLVGARFNLGTLSGRLRAPPMDSVVGQVLAALDDAITSAVSF